MSERFWDLGFCHKKARSLEIVKDGVIQPELQPVGIVEWFKHFNFDAEPGSCLDADRNCETPQL